jgi:two-component system, sensor histidine kinase and response regulator
MTPEKLNILIVDDVLTNFQVLQYSFDKAGYEVAFCDNGPDAIELSLKRHFDLILLDIMMPGMNGYEVCSKLKNNPATSHIPVIFITARADSDSLIRGFDAGAVDFITKPIKAPEILARAKTHITLKKTTERLKEINAMKDKILSIIAHDLRGPIGNFREAIELLLAGQDDIGNDFACETLKELQKSASNIYDLLQNLLTWAGSQNNTLEFSPKALDLNELIFANLTLLQSSAMKKSIKIDYTPTEQIHVMADENMISTVVRNLLSNAIKFSNPGTLVRVEAKKSADHVMVNIIDQGVGINKVKLQSIFSQEEFHSTFGTANEKGTGLGLKLCRDFVMKHGGNISAESEQGKGSVFSFSLPIPINIQTK